MQYIFDILDIVKRLYFLQRILKQERKVDVMKKWYRIGICLVLTVCLLLLPACKGGPTPPASDSDQSETGNVTEQTQSSDVTEQTQSVENVNKPFNPDALEWKTTVFQTFAGILADDAPEECVIRRFTYASWQDAIALNQNRHRNCLKQGCCSFNNRITCNVLEYFENAVSSQSFFEENTLLVINLRFDNFNEASVKNIRYEDGVLTCHVELDKPIRWILSGRKSIFLQTDVPLPADTELKLEITTKIDRQTEKGDIALTWEERYLSLSGWALWETDEPQIAKQLTYESFQELIDECVARHGTCSPSCYQYFADTKLCHYGETLRKLSYPKEFFETHSLFVLGLASGSISTVFDISDLQYVDGVLTCVIDRPHADSVLSTVGMGSWLCFIEVDTVLPMETEIQMLTGTFMYDYEIYKQKVEQFGEKCLP